ncbi:MAG: Ni/Fe hydrogenase subunit alpha [Planctomycetota bacterium]
MSKRRTNSGTGEADPNGQANKRTLCIKALARVEGEGSFRLIVRDGQVEDVELNIFEPPRFYEAFLRGRDFHEVPDIVARICGICPVAYQMSACYALEQAMGVTDQIDPAIHKLRDLFYCGEWVESHGLHMFILHLPDFLGYESALSMADDHRDLVQQSLRIKKAGNAVIEMLGGRSVHPVGACVGGFHAAPRQSQVDELLPELKSCRDDMCEMVLKLADMVEFPEWERDYEFVSLVAADEYPMNRGRIMSNKGLDVDQTEFGDAIEERQVSHSNALHAFIKGRGPYLVGPLARLNLNADKLHPRAAELVPRVCKSVGRSLPWNNNALSLLARGLEVVHAFALAVDLLEQYQPPARSSVPITPRRGRGRHGTEAPRGLCWHEYQTESDGTVIAARIVPPTSQNQCSVEEDLRELAPQLVNLSDEEATIRCEQVIRHYDPCISCSVHFLRLTRECRPGSGVRE